MHQSSSFDFRPESAGAAGPTQGWSLSNVNTPLYGSFVAPEIRVLPGQR